MSVGQSLRQSTFIQTEVSQQLLMDRNEFGDPLTFHPAPPPGQDVVKFLNIYFDLCRFTLGPPVYVLRCFILNNVPNIFSTLLTYMMGLKY